MIDPKNVAIFVPHGLRKFKLDLFERIGRKVEAAGGITVRHDPALLTKLPTDIIPIVGCSFELRDIIKGWRDSGRTWCYWDRGFARRVFATWLPRGESGGYYRWHLNCFQMQTIRDVPDDRWRALLPGNKVDPRPLEVLPWQRSGKHIVVASPSLPYERFHKIEGWTERTIAQLKSLTDQPIIIRDKESKRQLQSDLEGAHALVAHGSIAAVESVICGCPVFVDKSSAAALVGQTDISKIETPVYPERQSWLNALAYSQFNEQELTDGTLWRLIT